MKILFYRNDYAANVNRKLEDAYGGIGYYRIVQPANHVKDHQVDVVGININKKGEGRDKRWERIFTEYDVFWTSYFYDAEEASSIFYHRDLLKKKVVIDIDDNYLSIAPSHRLYDVMKETKKNRAFLGAILTFADALTVSTAPLKQKLAEHLKKVYNMEKPIIIIPNMNDVKQWDFKPAEKHKDRIVIGYTGSNSHYDDLQMVFPQIAKIMDKHKNVYFEVLGSLTNDEAVKLFSCFSKKAKKRCDLIPATSTFREYPKHLASMKWDIGIAPLVDTDFTRSKSPIKFFEYSMYKIPTIASRVYPYYVPSFGRDVITHDETGLLVKPSEWFNALEDLILNKEKRIALGERAYEHVKQNWQYNDEFSDALTKVVKAL